MPSIRVVWSTNTDELRRQLSQGLDQINATRASVDKLVQSFKGEGLAVAAHKWAAAISEIGGVTKLTAAEQERANAIFQKFIEKQQALGQLVPAAIQNLARETSARLAATRAVQQQAEAQSKLRDLFQSTLGAVGLSGLSGAGVAGALAIGANEALAYADALSKLSDRTGVSVVGLQRLEAIAKPSGNSLEEIANAINRFQKNLVEGSTETQSALSRIGLSIADLVDLGPDEQFISIARALQGIKDPAEQAFVAMQLFGKGGAEILPSLKANVDELADSTFKMSKEAVAAWDAFGDAVDRNKRSILNALGEIIAKGQSNPAALLTLLGGQLGVNFLAPNTGPPKPPSSVARGDIQLFNQAPVAPPDALLRAIEAQSRELFAAAQFKLDEPKRQAAERLYESIRKLEVIMPGLREQVGALNETELKAIEAWLAKKKVAADLAAELSKLQNVRLGHVDLENLPGDSTNEIGNLKARAKAVEEQAKAEEEAFKKRIARLQSARTAFGELAGAFASVAEASDGATSRIAQNFANIAGAIERGIGAWQRYEESAQSAYDKLSALFSGVSTILQGTSGGGRGTRTIGGALSGASAGLPFAELTGGASIAIGAGIGALTGYVRALTAESREARAALDALFKTVVEDLAAIRYETSRGRGAVGSQANLLVGMQDGLEKIKQRAEEAGISVDRFLHAGGGENLKNAIKELTDAFAFQDDALKQLHDTIVKYHFSLKELGPAAATQELGQRAAELFREFKLLDSAGVPFENIAKRMKKSIQDLVKDALKSGASLPDFLKPLLEQMAAAGLLVDATGRRITSLEQSGIHFTQSVSSSIDRLVDTIDKLAEALAKIFHINFDKKDRSLPPPKPNGIGSDGGSEVPQLSTGGIVRPWGAQRYFGDGGVAMLPRGRDLIPAYLADREMVINEAQQANLWALANGRGRRMGPSSERPIVNINAPLIDARGGLNDTYGLRQLAKRLQSEGDFWTHVYHNARGEYTAARAALNLPV